MSGMRSSTSGWLSETAQNKAERGQKNAISFRALLARGMWAEGSEATRPSLSPWPPPNASKGRRAGGGRLPLLLHSGPRWVIDSTILLNGQRLGLCGGFRGLVVFLHLIWDYRVKRT